MNSEHQPQQIAIETEDCVACGSCYGELPHVFGADDDGTAFVHHPFAADEAELQNALERCAGGCIYWRDLQGPGND